MKHLKPIFLLVLILFLLVAVTWGMTADRTVGIAPAGDQAFGFTADVVARVQVEDWSQPGHPYFEAIKLDGNWVQLVVGTDGFTAEYTRAKINDLINAVLGLPTGDLSLDQPAGLDLDSRDGTYTPIHFCITLVTVSRDYRAVCSDQANDSSLWLAEFDSISHFRGWYALPPDGDSAVIEAMRGL